MKKIDFKLEGEYIELIALLKATGIAHTGGQAKHMVDEGLVSCNGTIEHRKRYKVRRGDRITAAGTELSIS